MKNGTKHHSITQQAAVLWNVQKRLESGAAVRKVRIPATNLELDCTARTLCGLSPLVSIPLPVHGKFSSWNRDINDRDTWISDLRFVMWQSVCHCFHCSNVIFHLLLPIFLCLSSLSPHTWTESTTGKVSWAGKVTFSFYSCMSDFGSFLCRFLLQ